jgi:hypothetical protein
VQRSVARRADAAKRGSAKREDLLFQIDREVFMKASDNNFEKFYRVKDIAGILSIGRETARKLVMNEPGVMKICIGKKQAHQVLCIPESVLRRVIARHTSRA